MIQQAGIIKDLPLLPQQPKANTSLLVRWLKYQRNKKLRHWLLEKVSFPLPYPILELSPATLYNANHPNQSFQLVYGINAHASWQYPVREFARIRQWLQPGGRLVLVFRPRHIKNQRDLANLARLTHYQLQKAGFHNIVVELKPGAGIYVEGTPAPPPTP